MSRLIECVPNFSEGRRPEVLAAIVAAIASIEDIRVIGQEMDRDHNRAVVTFVGEPEAVKAAAFAGCAKASELIDLTSHTGVHPRIGATDVIPLIPISDVTVEECIAIAQELGRLIADRLGIPVYLYEKAAARPDRQNLADVRKRQFEGLKQAIEQDPNRVPDYGEPRIHSTAGATAVGVRDFLIAYNVHLDTDRLDIAREIASTVRQKGGGFPFVKANGFETKERGCVQVSMNLTNYRVSGMHHVFEFIKCEAERCGVNVLDSELVGLVPLEALLDTSKHYLHLQNLSRDQVLENRLWKGEPIDSAPNSFLDSVAAKTPTPGGGSVAALVGALAAALGSMVCRLTVGRKDYEAVSEELSSALRKTERLRRRLTETIKIDANTYSKVIQTIRTKAETPDAAAAKRAALQSAYKKAAEVPLDMMLDIEVLVTSLKQIASEGNVNAASDIGVAALMARAACEGACLNIETNVLHLNDSAFRLSATARANEINDSVGKAVSEILDIVRSRTQSNVLG